MKGHEEVSILITQCIISTTGKLSYIFIVYRLLIIPIYNVQKKLRWYIYGNISS